MATDVVTGTSVERGQNGKEYRLTIPRPGREPQVYDYDTKDELAELMRETIENEQNHISQIEEENRQHRARTVNAQDETPDPYYDPESFTPRDLTPGERMQLARDTQDPAKAQEAWDRAFEARTGMKPARFAQRASDAELQRLLAQVTAAGREFARETPEFAKTNSNSVALSDYMKAHGMTPASVKNWRIAFRALKVAGALELIPQGGNGNGSQRDSATGGRAGDSNATPAAGGGDSANDGWQSRDRSSGLGNRSGAGTPRGGGRPQFPSVEELRRLHSEGKLATMLLKDKKLAAHVDGLPPGSIV